MSLIASGISGVESNQSLVLSRQQEAMEAFIERHERQIQDVKGLLNELDEACFGSTTKKNLKKVKREPNSMFAVSVARALRHIRSEHKKIARDNPNSLFAINLAHNLAYLIEEADKEFAREHPDSYFVRYLAQRPDYVIEEKDKEVARWYPGSHFAIVITQRLATQQTSNS